VKLKTYHQSQIWLAARGKARSHVVVASSSGPREPMAAPALEEGGGGRRVKWRVAVTSLAGCQDGCTHDSGTATARLLGFRAAFFEVGRLAIGRASRETNTAKNVRRSGHPAPGRPARIEFWRGLPLKQALHNGSPGSGLCQPRAVGWLSASLRP
jgi:hypothetical protein